MIPFSPAGARVHRLGDVFRRGMNPKYKKIYCCTPVSFIGGESFFTRDTGLISKTLRSLGVESKCIMPLPWHEGSLRENIIRTEYKNLESIEWWKSLGIDALVLYSWGAPRYRKIARAVHKAGIRLHIHLDTSGYFEGADYEEMRFAEKIARKLRVLAQDFLRSYHLRFADTISAGEPVLHAIASRLFYGKWIVEKGVPMASPISPKCCYDGSSKKPIILFVGRWNDARQKRPEFVMQALEHFSRLGVQAEIRIFGTLTEELRSWYSGLPAATANSIKLVGLIPNSELIAEYNNAQIIACCSRYEGSHLASSEALCCGASVVVTNIPKSLRTVHWYASKKSGRVSDQDSPESFAVALREELRAWEQNERAPHAIAATWQPFFHVDKVLNEIFR